LNDATIVTLLSLVPKHGTARAMGGAARTRLPAALHRALLRWYVKTYEVDLTECVGGIDDYPTLADFFLRPLKPGVRTIDPDPDALVSPVDGRVHTVGVVQEGTFSQSADRRGQVAALLGAGDPRVPGALADEAKKYEGGPYAVIYLSPKDYHRVHTPTACAVEASRYLPGALWPVFPAATRKITDLFGRNERLVFQLRTDFGDVAFAMIGAFGVGRMSTSIADLVTHTGNPGEARALQPPVALGRAAEIGRFELGSTVILFGTPGAWRWTVSPGDVVRLGQPIGRRG
jgi:phosphatidylserine decarboxylase